MKFTLKVLVACSWLPGSSLPVMSAKGQDTSRFELSRARVRVRCSEPPRWIIGNVTALSDSAVKIEGPSALRIVSRSDIPEIERSLGKPRYVVVWGAAVGAFAGYAIGASLGGNAHGDFSLSGLSALAGLPVGAVTGAIMSFVFRREEWMPVIDPWRLRRQSESHKG